MASHVGCCPPRPTRRGSAGFEAFPLAETRPAQAIDEVKEADMEQPVDQDRLISR
jgi:hypothetical protein